VEGRGRKREEEGRKGNGDTPNKNLSLHHWQLLMQVSMEIQPGSQRRQSPMLLNVA